MSTDVPAHYLRFARAVALLVGVGGAATGCAATAASDCDHCAYGYSDCDAALPGPYPDSGVPPLPSCSDACRAAHPPAICGPLTPPELADRAYS